MMVGVFERVYEIAPVFRAEKHDTARHLNEYTSVDFENFEDIMAMEQENCGEDMDGCRRHGAGDAGAGDHGDSDRCRRA